VTEEAIKRSKFSEAENRVRVVAGGGWHDGDDDFYFDRINQIRMPSRSRGHVAVVGDAGYCVSPLAGFGGSMAIIGAGRLAAARCAGAANGALLGWLYQGRQTARAKRATF
jgi:2-polyprenyl-6-methoxyphenol hydroxylase-like FAD-dependent oxidoreductase